MAHTGDTPELVLYVVRSDEARSTLTALAALNDALPRLNEGGIRVSIVPIRPSGMKSRDVCDELAEFGVERMPALVNPRGDGERPLAEGSKNVCDTLAHVVASLRQDRDERATAGRKKRAGATTGPNEYHGWVTDNIGTPGRADDDDEETGDAMGASAMRTRMQEFMERRKQLGMSTGASHGKGQGEEVPKATGRAKKKTGGARKKPRGEAVASGDIMRSVKKSAAKMDAADAMMAAALFSNRETT
jgi:hypothetical protein